MATGIETTNRPVLQDPNLSQKVEAAKRLSGTAQIPLFALVVGMVCSIVNTEITGMSAMTRSLQHMVDKSNEFTNTLKAALTGDKSAIPKSMSISDSSSQSEMLALQDQLQMIGNEAANGSNSMSNQSYLISTTAEWMKGSYMSGVASIYRIIQPMETTQVIK